ncbi:hypothetical protein N665_0026s0039 [Sinapis alba]|nr:hypothetical protein N665_0026s0039 [Sinapis alba]
MTYCDLIGLKGNSSSGIDFWIIDLFIIILTCVPRSQVYICLYNYGICIENVYLWISLSMFIKIALESVYIGLLVESNQISQCFLFFSSLVTLITD